MIIRVSCAIEPAHVFPGYFEITRYRGSHDVLGERTFPVGTRAAVAVMYLILDICQLVLQVPEGVRIRKGVSFGISISVMRHAWAILPVTGPPRYNLRFYSVALFPATGYSYDSLTRFLVYALRPVGLRLHKLSGMLLSPPRVPPG